MLYFFKDSPTGWVKLAHIMFLLTINYYAKFYNISFPNIVMQEQALFGQNNI